MNCVSDYMTRSPITVTPTAPIDLALELVVRYQISGLPVVEDGSRPVGVISQTDLLSLFFKCDGRPTSCQELMTRELTTVSPETSLDDAVSTMIETEQRMLLVVRDERLVGVLSRCNVLQRVQQIRQSSFSLLESTR